jgi:TonB-linked SusC/RagA family outer membrane protein
MRKLFLSLWCSLLLLSGDLLAQTRTITGKITDANGNPVPNASVLVKGTHVGTVTNSDGTYSLSVPPNAKTLMVSSLGLQTQEIKIGSTTEYNLVMKNQDASMDEVVVVGYNSIAKRSLTGSVGRVNGDAVANKPVTSFDQALAGKAAGVQVGTASGEIGDEVIIRVRGAASITSGSSPLIVMDGVPITQGDQGQLYNKSNVLAEINPNDIENIEVLKDASATAIYGSRGAGGVILITTKKGKSGQNNLNYDSYIGFDEAARNMKVLDAADYITTINKLRTNAGQAPAAFYGDIDGDGKPDTVNTDWQKVVARKGLVQNHNLALSGGTQRSTYYAAMNYNDIQSYMNANEQKRISVRLNLTSRVTDWLSFGINTQYSRTKTIGHGSGTGNALSGIPFGPMTAMPNIPVYGPDGKYYYDIGGNTIAYNTPNPAAVINSNYDNRDARRIIASAYGEAQLMKGLKFKSQVNIDNTGALNDNWWNPEVGDGQGYGLRQTVYSENNVWSWFNTLNYNRQFGADHELNALLGTEYTRWRGYYSYNYGADINDPDLRIISSNNYKETGGENGTNNTDHGLASYFGTINYGYKRKYLATVTFRTDGDSRFLKGHRFDYFPSGSVGWRVTEEEFMSHISWLKDLKVRASYGATGNTSIPGYFPALSTYAPGSYADIGVLTVSSPGNPNLRWERNIQFDAGVDAVIFNNINVTLDYFNRKTDNLILSSPVLATLGFPNNTLDQNVGKFGVSGVELAVNTPVLQRKNFQWNVNWNIAWNHNKVIKTNATGDDIYDADGAATFSLARPGYSLGSFYLIRWAGVNPANGLATFLDSAGNRKQYDPATKSWSMVKDGSPTTQVTASDRKIDKKKTPYPKIYGGLSQTFTLFSFDASIDLQYAFGFYVYDQTKQTIMSYTNSRNKSEDILKAWSKAGDNTDVPRLYYGDNQWSQTSTRWLEKGDFVRIRNVQIGYSLPKSVTGKIKFSRVRFYIQANNLYTFTGYTGIDPEANSTGNTNIGLGIDRTRPYLPRTYTFGVNVGL